jgi:hypothetical protein
MRSVGKWPLDESGKHPVNEDGEEKITRANMGTHAPSASLRATRSAQSAAG